MSVLSTPVFDAHTHVYPEKLAARAVENLGAFYNMPIEGKGMLADLEETSRAAGVMGFLLFSVATNAHQVSKVNDGIAAAVRSAREHGFAAVGFAAMHCDFPDPVGELTRAVDMGLCGVKLHPDIQETDIDDPRLFPLYEELERRDLILCLHMGDDRPQYRFSEVDKLCRMKLHFPRLRVLAAHLGGHRNWEDAERLRDVPNVYFDTSSSLWLLTPERAAALIRHFGTNRVLFGTDYPVRHAEGELARFMALPGFTDAERKEMLYDNAARLFGL